MKISYNWLSKYIDIPYSRLELIDRLTMLGVEVESFENLNHIPETVVVAEILERKPHPNANRLSVCIVNSGTENLQIVCGAPNCDVGKRVPLAKIGTIIDAHRPHTKSKIKQATLRGVDSFGMLCSGSELGITSNTLGLLELPEDYEIGMPVNEYYKSDTIYDLEITSNRPDLNSFIGIAREIQAVSDKKIKYPESKIALTGFQYPTPAISVEDFEGCPKYTARLIKNVKVTESPKWLKESLQSIGLRPINNIVDITNFVMFETGQPLHAFDFKKIKGGKIVVRRAKNGEKIITLDQKEYELNNEHLVVADSSSPLAIAGVMGGKESCVGFETQDVLVESAYFNSSMVKKATRAFTINSDSSYRFERGIDFSALETANNRAALLIQDLACGQIASELVIVENKTMLPVPKKVLCRFDKIRKILGIEISNEEIISILIKLELGVKNITNTSCEVQSKSFRLDIELEADLAEEVIRVYGLQKLQGERVHFDSVASYKTDSYHDIETVRNQLIAFGLKECVNYTLIDRKQVLKDNLFNTEELFEVINPINTESSVMRPSLLFGMLKVVNKNIAHNTHDLTLFEIGKIYAKNHKKEEAYSCCIILTGRVHPELYSDAKKQVYDFFDMKGLLESWLRQLATPSYSLCSGKSPLFKKGVAADIIIKNEVIASFGELLDNFSKGMRLRSPLYVAVVNLEKLTEYAHYNRVSKYTPIPVYPSVSRDVALVCDESLNSSEIISCIESSGCTILESVELFDLYHDGEALGNGKKGVAYSLTYRRPDRTLTDSEVNKAHEIIRNTLVSKLAIELR